MLLSHTGSYRRAEPIKVCATLIMRNLFDLNICRTLRLGETELLLARVSLDDMPKKPGHVRQSSDELLDELQDKLGESMSDYLTVTVCCKPSALPNCQRPVTTRKGMSVYTTSISVDVRATIKRHSPASVWTKSKSSFLSEYSCQTNPVNDLICSHYHDSKAQEIIGLTVSTPDTIPTVYRRQLTSDCAWVSSSEIVLPIECSTDAEREVMLGKPLSKSSLEITEACVSSLHAYHKPLTPRASEEADPARQIWSQMRQVSRGNRKLNRKVSDSSDTAHRDELLAHLEKTQTKDLKDEQTRIMQTALRNKRSIGADTLRSMASPSTKIGITTGKNVWGWLW